MNIKSAKKCFSCKILKLARARWGHAGRLLQKTAWEKAPALTAARRRHATQANEAGDCRGKLMSSSLKQRHCGVLKSSSLIRSLLRN